MELGLIATEFVDPSIHPGLIEIRDKVWECKDKSVQPRLPSLRNDNHEMQVFYFIFFDDYVEHWDIIFTTFS